MPWNLMLLPLIGGYVAIHRLYYTRYRALRLQGHRLLIEGAFVGVILLAIARLATSYLLDTGVGESMHRWWVRVVGEVPWSATCFGAMVLGFVLPTLANLLLSSWLETARSEKTKVLASVLRPLRAAWRGAETKIQRLLQSGRDHALDWAIDCFGDPLHALLRWAVIRDKPVMISLRDRKVYVGMVTEVPEGGPDHEFLVLLPVISGFRDPSSLKVCLTTPYPAPSEVSDDLDFEGEDLSIVVPMSQVQSAHLFDQEVWEQGYFSEVPEEAELGEDTEQDSPNAETAGEGA